MQSTLLSEEPSWESMLNQELINLYEDYPEEGRSALLHALSTKQDLNLKGLSLSCNPLTPEDLGLVATIVERANALVYLDLSHCDLAEEHTTVTNRLGFAIARHSKLRSLLLSSNDLTSHSLPCLQEIMLNGTLLELGLSCIKSIDEGVGQLLLDHLKDTRCRIVSLNLIGTLVLKKPTIDKAISTQLNINIERLLEQPRNWIGIDIPESIVAFLREQQNHLFDHHTEAQKMRYQPLICLKERQLKCEATNTASEILHAYSAASAAQETSNLENLNDPKNTFSTHFKQP